MSGNILSKELLAEFLKWAKRNDVSQRDIARYAKLNENHISRVLVPFKRGGEVKHGFKRSWATDTIEGKKKEIFGDISKKLGMN